MSYRGRGENMKKIIGIIVCVALLACSAWRIITLNQAFADWGKEEINEVNQPQIYNGVEISFSDFDCLPRDEAIQKYDLDEGELSEPLFSEKILIVRVHLKNVSEETKKIDMTQFVFQTGIVACGLDPYLITALNLDEPINLIPELKPNEEYTEEIGTIFSSVLVKDRSLWENFEQQKFEVVLSLDPQKIVMKLN